MQRIIIHIDLDFFYGQCEQARNPSLSALPFAIQQKHIVVTCNYLARAAGVKKLQLLTDAKRCCPNLVIVNGEDIQKYRDSSKEVFQHVRNLVGGGNVQRLGMDELWLDVTEHIIKHEEQIRSDELLEIDAKQLFELGTDFHFRYFPGRDSGHTLGTYDGSLEHQRLRIASHLAAHLRESIRSKYTFTSSAGVSCSKLIAKLVGDKYKPNDQTLIYPEEHQVYLDDVEVKKIAGVGYTILKILFEKLSDAPRILPRSVEITVSDDENDEDLELSHNTLEKVDDGEDFKLISKQKEELLNNNPVKLTVAYVRQNTTESLLVDWFGVDRGVWLWQILHAKDDSVVVPSSLYPKSIGLEDSFLHCTELPEVKTRLRELTEDLLHRMEGDLMEARKWVRWPTILRLTPRFRADHGKNGELWKHKRTSRSVPLPVDVFLTSKDVKVRAAQLVEGTLMPLFKKIAAEKGDWDLSLLNVAVAEIKTSAPTAGINEYFDKERDGKRKHVTLDQDSCPPGLDAAIWQALDPATKREIWADPSIVTEQESSEHKRVRFEEVEESDQAPHSSDTRENEDWEPWPEDEADDHGFLCTNCQSVIPHFAKDSHVCFSAV